MELFLFSKSVCVLCTGNYRFFRNFDLTILSYLSLSHCMSLSTVKMTFKFEFFPLYPRFNDNDVDSGQGSSLDRDYGLYNNGGYKQPNNMPNKADQYYYNLPQHPPGTGTSNGTSPPRRSEGLDLTNNREYRGSAFELYKKPLSEAKPPPPQQYYGNQTVTR